MKVLRLCSFFRIVLVVLGILHFHITKLQFLIDKETEVPRELMV